VQSLTERFYPESRFGHFTRVDGTLPFFMRVQSLVTPDMVVLDLGCGRGQAADRFEQNPWERCRVLKGKCRKVIGIDVDPVGQTNPMIDEFRQIEGPRWPVDDRSIDLIVSDAVLEHIEDPDQYFAECRRVLKPGGFLCVRTPNRWSYISIAAQLVPNRYHAAIVGKVQPGRDAKDVFPTYFRANTPRAMYRLLKRHGFDGYAYRHIAEPTYLRFSTMAYGIGVVVHRWLPSVMWPMIFLFAQRRSDDR
jgi:SAM-dependent methyltransferase